MTLNGLPRPRPRNWQSKDAATISLASESKWDVETQLEKTLQTIEGFGACFNELGWTSLSALPDDADRHAADIEVEADAGCEQLQPQTY